MISIIPLNGIPKISQGDDLSELIRQSLEEHFPLTENDCLVVASKVVSKARGRVLELTDTVTKADVVKSESRRVLRQREGLIITETHHGFICANAGIDESNVDAGSIVLLPKDIDSAAHGIRQALLTSTGFDIPVIVSDTFSRPFRKGEVNVALGYSGIQTFADLRGKPDLYGQTINSTIIAIADEIASAAELVMHKASGVCAVLIRGIDSGYRGSGKATELVRNPQDDLFR